MVYAYLTAPPKTDTCICLRLSASIPDMGRCTVVLDPRESKKKLQRRKSCVHQSKNLAAQADGLYV